MRKTEWTIEDFLTVAEAAHRKGIGVTTLYRAIHRNELPVLRLAGLIFVSPSDLEAYKPRFLRRRRLRAKRAAASGERLPQENGN